MGNPQPTDQDPEPDLAYRFRLPTGRRTPDGDLEYDAWTRFMPFSGDWAAARFYGVQRSVESKEVKLRSDKDVFWFPEVVHEPAGNEKASELRDAYREHLLQILDAPLGLSPDTSRRAAARAAEEPRQSLTVHIPLQDKWPMPEMVDRIQELSHSLSQALAAQSAGEYDGDEYGEGTCTLFMYGPEADAVFAAIHEVLLASPLIQETPNVTVKRGYGEPWQRDRQEVETPIDAAV